MKIETREVRETITVYIADDGNQFLTKEYCEEHEMKCLEETLSFYDHKFDKSDLESCTYMWLKNEEDIQKALELCGYHGITVRGFDEDAKPGVYMFTYNRGKDEWFNISEPVDRIRST